MGKVLTITTKGVDTSGKPFNSVAVYDKDLQDFCQAFIWPIVSYLLRQGR